MAGARVLCPALSRRASVVGDFWPLVVGDDDDRCSPRRGERSDPPFATTSAASASVAVRNVRFAVVSIRYSASVEKEGPPLTPLLLFVGMAVGRGSCC